MNKKIIILCFILCLITLMKDDILADSKFDSCIQKALKQNRTTKANLKKLDCSNQNISFISNIKELKSLTYLNVSNNKLKEIPNDLFLLSNLKSLNYSNNSLVKVNKKINKLKKLKYLNLSGNTLYYLPKEINDLVNLEKIDLSSTHLLVFPSTSKLTKLKTLYLSNNQLLITPSLINNPITNLEINNNYLAIKKIRTSKKTFQVNNQKNLVIKDKIINLSNYKSLYTPVEYLQRTIVSNDEIPLYGISSYTLRDSRDGKNNKVNHSDYFNFNTGEVYQSGVVTSYVDLNLNGRKYKTNIKVIFKLTNILNNGGNKIDYSNDDVLNDKKGDITKKESTNVFENMKEQELSIIDTAKFFNIDNIFFLSMILLIFTIIPFIVIISIISETERAKNDIESVYLNRK